MRIDRLTVTNFKGFKSREFMFHPQFNLIVGINGTGKTSLLDALGVATSTWHRGIRDEDTRSIRPKEVMLRQFENKDRNEDGEYHSVQEWVRAYPCEISASGFVQGRNLAWTISRDSPSETRFDKAREMSQIAKTVRSSIHNGENSPLPLISYYGPGRAWQEPHESFAITDPLEVAREEEQPRLSAYWNSVEPHLSVVHLTRWIGRQSWITFQQLNRVPPVFLAVKKAMVSCIEGALDLYFDAILGEVIVALPTGTLPFSYLSDGQRSMLAMVGDIALKAAKLNPQFGRTVLEETSGVVLVDELDLHLHPRWQRGVIENLRRVFPKIQFFCTTHSPFLIQSLRRGEELIVLDGEPLAEVANKSIEEIAQWIQGVDDIHVSQRYEEMKHTAQRYYEMLEQGSAVPRDRLNAFKNSLAEELMPYADNPAFQAFLEMKRAAKLGS